MKTGDVAGRFDLKTLNALVTTVGGSGSFRANPINMFRAINGAISYDDIPSAIFDQYEVIRFHIDYTPTIGNSTACPSALICYDADDPDTANITSTSVANDYAGVRRFDLRYKWSYSIRPTPLSASSTATVISTRGWYDFAAPPIQQAVFVVIEGAPVSTTLGTFFFTMSVAVRNQR